MIVKISCREYQQQTTLLSHSLNNNKEQTNKPKPNSSTTTNPKLTHPQQQNPKLTHPQQQTQN